MKHLSPEQISSVVAGIRIPEEDHLRNCADCAREVERVQSVLTVFRSSVREWTDRLLSPPSPRPTQTRGVEKNLWQPTPRVLRT